MNRHADDHHPGVSDNIARLRPVIFLQDTHLVAGEGQHLLKQPAHLTAAAHNHYRTQRRAEGFEPFIVLAGVGFTHHASEHVLNQIRRHAKRLGLLTAGSQHSGLALGHVDRQAIFTLNLADLGHQIQTLRQQGQQRLIYFINLIAQGGQFSNHNNLLSQTCCQMPTQMLVNLTQQRVGRLPADAGIGHGDAMFHIATRLLR